MMRATPFLLAAATTVITTMMVDAVIADNEKVVSFPQSHHQTTTNKIGRRDNESNLRRKTKSSKGDRSSSMDAKTVYQIYLSGPEVFLADPFAAGEESKAACEEANDPDADFFLEAVYPLDAVIEDFQNDFDTGMRIYYANVGLMDNAFATASNMVRFRSPSMDVGTVSR